MDDFNQIIETISLTMGAAWGSDYAGVLSAPVFAGNFWLNKSSEILKLFGRGDKVDELMIEEIGAGLKK